MTPTDWTIIIVAVVGFLTVACIVTAWVDVRKTQAFARIEFEKVRPTRNIFGEVSRVGEEDE